MKTGCETAQHDVSNVLLIELPPEGKNLFVENIHILRYDSLAFAG